MTTSSSNTNASTFSPAPSLTDSPGPEIHCSLAFRAIFGIISVMAVAGNILVCAVILRSRETSRNSYIIMILALAIVDALTGVILALTPKFVVDEEEFPVPGGVPGEIFCHLVSSQYFLFSFGKFSLFLVMLLSFERWYSMAKPLKYRFSFSRNKTLLWIAAIMVLSFAMNTPVLLSKVLIYQENKPKCTWRAIPQLTDELVDQVCTVIYVTITFFIPLAITLGTFIHLRILVKRSRAPDQVRPRTREISERYFLRMCAVTALFLGICWIPNQLLYLLSKFGVTKLQTTLHHFTIMLSMLNSCVNPWIYGATNKKYRKDFLRILCFWKSPQIQPEAVDVLRDRTRTVMSHLDGKDRQEQLRIG